MDCHNSRTDPFTDPFTFMTLSGLTLSRLTLSRLTRRQNTKHQDPNTREAPNSKLQHGSTSALFGIWGLNLLWSLVFGVWCLVFSFGFRHWSFITERLHGIDSRHAAS